MSNSYVDSKVREALVASRGSRNRAQQLLMAWAAEDDRLMQGIARPYLKAISAAAIERGIRNLTGGGATSSPSRSVQGARGSQGGGSGVLSRDALENVLSRLGQGPDIPGISPQAREAARPTSQSGNSGGGGHERSMMAIAKAFAAKKGR